MAALAKQKDTLNMTIITPNVLTASLHISQAGSAYDYAKALASLTVGYPDAWTRYYNGSGKKSATKRLCQFLRKGSQGGPSEYWLHVSSLLHHVPKEVLLPKSDAEPVEALNDPPEPNLAVLEAFHEGLISRDEPRENQGVAWNVYIDVSAYLQSTLDRPEERYQLLDSCVLPLLAQYVKPSREFSGWTLPGPQQISICFGAFEQTVKGALDLLEKEWHRLSATIVNDIRTSLPEQSKDYAEAHNSLSAETNRWYSLQAVILKQDASDPVRSLLTSTLPIELQSAVDTLRARNGKPYSAASILEAAIRLLPELVLRCNDVQEIITEFVSIDIPKLLLSPSAPYCIDILNHIGGVLDVRQTYRDAIVKLQEAPESAAKTSALQRLISSSSLNQPGEAELLGSIVKNTLQQVMTNDSSDWALVMAAMGNPVVPTELTDDLISSMTNGLSIDEERTAGLHGLESTAEINKAAIKSFVLSNSSSDLLSRLLRLSESSDENVSQQAKKVGLAIEATLSEETGSGHATRSLIEIINKGINTAESDSLSYVIVVYASKRMSIELTSPSNRIESLVGQACKVWDQAPGQEKSSVAAELLPDTAQFAAAFDPFLAIPPNTSLAVTNALGGAISLVEQPSTSKGTKIHMARDIDGYSPALRTAWFTIKLFKATNILSFVTEEQQAVQWKHISVFLQLAGDNVSVPGSNDLWNRYEPDLEAEILDLITEGQGLLASWLHLKSQGTATLSAIVQKQLLEDSHGSSAASYYSARAYSVISADHKEFHGHTALNGEVERLRSMRKSQEVFPAAAFLASASDLKALLRLCNELISDLTSRELYEKTEQGTYRYHPV